MANAATATFAGRSILWSRMRSLGTEPKNLSWGDPVPPLTGSANGDVALFKPQTEARVAGTSTMLRTTQLADTYQVQGTITCLVGGKTIMEAGLHDTTTASPTTTVATSSLAAASTVITLAAASGILGGGNYYRQVENEVVLVTAGQNTTVETITRAQLGTTSAAHGPGATTTVGGDGGASANGSIVGQTATIGAAQGGSLFAHADFAGVVLAVNDSIAFTWTDQLT